MGAGVGLVAFEAGAGGDVEGAGVFGDGADGVVGGAIGEIGFDVDGDGDVGVGDGDEVGDDLLGDLAGVAADAGGIEFHRAVVAAVVRGLRLRRVRVRSRAQVREDRSSDRPCGRLAGSGGGRPHRRRGRWDWGWAGRDCWVSGSWQE